jgi:hypothetical protein
VAVAIAARAALRALPALFTASGKLSPERYGSALLLPCFRATVTGVVFPLAPTTPVARAAADAAVAADVADVAAAAAAALAAEAAALAAEAAAAAADAAGLAVADASAALAVADVSAALAAFWKAVEADCRAVEGGADLAKPMSRPLWSAEAPEPDKLAKLWGEFSRDLEARGGMWAFWRDWLAGFRDGRPMDWKLQEEIALIPDEDWQAGPERVAEKIAEIRGRYLARATARAERMAFDPEDGKFFAVPQDFARPALLQTHLSRISDRLNAAIAMGNGLNERSPETAILRNTVSVHAGDAQRVEMDCTDVLWSITLQLGKDLPDDQRHQLLVRALWECAEAIRANDEEIRKNREDIDTARVRSLTAEQKLRVVEVAEKIAAILKKKEAEQAIEDAEIITTGDPATPRSKNAVRRYVGRPMEIWAMLRDPEVQKKIKEHPAYVAVDIGGKVAFLTGILIKVFGYLI